MFTKSRLPPWLQIALGLGVLVLMSIRILVQRIPFDVGNVLTIGLGLSACWSGYQRYLVNRNRDRS
jgi:hypothetical protein